MGKTTNGIPYPDELSPYPSRLWWKALAEAIDPWIGKLAGLPDKLGLADLLKTKIDKPAGPRTGQVLTYNGSEWVAWDTAAGSGTGGTGGSVLPISQKGSFLVGTGTDWVVLPGGVNDGSVMKVDSTNPLGYTWDSPFPSPSKGSVLVSTPAGWVPLAPPVKDGMALVSDTSEVSGVRWGSEMPNPARGSVLVADGTKWTPVPWSGRDGEALVVDVSKPAGVKWGGVLPTPLKGALLVGDGLAWRLITAPVSGNYMFMSDPGSTNGVNWSSNYVRPSDLDLYATKQLLKYEYVTIDEIDSRIANSMARRWKPWATCRMASGWTGSIRATHDGTMIALEGTAYPGSGAGNTICYLPSGFPSVYATGFGTHVRIPLSIGGTMYDIGGVRPSVITFSGSSVSTHGTIATMDKTYGTKMDGCIAVIV